MIRLTVDNKIVMMFMVTKHGIHRLYDCVLFKRMEGGESCRSGPLLERESH